MTTEMTTTRKTTIKPATEAQRWARQRAYILYRCLSACRSLLQNAINSGITSNKNIEKLYKAQKLVDEVYREEITPEATGKSRMWWMRRWANRR